MTYIFTGERGAGRQRKVWRFVIGLGICKCLTLAVHMRIGINLAKILQSFNWRVIPYSVQSNWKEREKQYRTPYSYF
jgi:hypothetical protein